MLIEQLQEALNETQLELRDVNQQLQLVPCLIGALKLIAKDACERGLDREQLTAMAMSDCGCHTCVARGGLTRFLDRRSIPPTAT